MWYCWAYKIFEKGRWMVFWQRIRFDKMTFYDPKLLFDLNGEKNQNLKRNQRSKKIFWQTQGWDLQSCKRIKRHFNFLKKVNSISVYAMNFFGRQQKSSEKLWKYGNIWYARFNRHANLFLIQRFDWRVHQELNSWSEHAYDGGIGCHLFLSISIQFRNHESVGCSQVQLFLLYVLINWSWSKNRIWNHRRSCFNEPKIWEKLTKPFINSRSEWCRPGKRKWLDGSPKW